MAFQPHTYSRTRELLREFAEALRLADGAYVLDVYAAREVPDPAVSGEALARLAGASAIHVGSVDQAAELIPDQLQAGTVLITMGAGDVTELGARLLEALRARERPA